MRKKRMIAVIIVVGSLSLTSITFYVYQLFTAPNILVEKPDRHFFIPPGSNFKYIQNSLFDSGFVHDLVAFSFMAKIMNYDRQVKPGKYLLKTDMSNREVLNLFRSGQQAPVNVTFNNIRLKSELAEKICRNVIVDPVEFEELLNDEEKAQKYGFNLSNFMTMFIPDTYQVYWTITAAELLDRMNQEYQKFWDEERIRKAEQSGLTQHQISILASIVAAESIKKDESSRIAGVYINRLNRGIALQADPTIIYAIGDFSIKRVLNKDKEIDSPFNTYKYRGLPPGPINLPSIHAIDAVLNYEKHKYLYFCAKEDFSGYHNFATNLRDHNNNANRYQRALNQARLYR